MKRGTAAKVILGKDTLMDVPSGIVHGTDVILGGKAGLLNDFGGLVLSNNLMIGKKVSRGTITTVTVRGQSPLVLPDAIAGSLQAVKAFGGTEQPPETYLDTVTVDGKCVQNGTPTPTTPVDIVCNNGTIKVKDSELPVGYRRVLGYTCDNNVLWQITDFHLRGSDTVRISFSVNTACNVFGCYQGADATDNYDLYVSTNAGSKYLRYGDGTYLSFWSNADLGQRFDVVFAPTGTTGMPQDSTWTPLTFEAANDFLVAATTLTGTSSKLKGNLYGNIEVDGRLKLIPCERVSDGVLGYFDTYSQTFYEPQGTATSLGYDGSYTAEIYADGTVETVTDSNGLTATCQNLLSVGDYKDTQEIITGDITRKVGIKVLDGTETWSEYTYSGTTSFYTNIQGAISTGGVSRPIVCSHFSVIQFVWAQNNPGFCFDSSGTRNIYFNAGAISVSTWKQFLAAQYAAGTPVIIVYPLAAENTESVAGQVLQKAPVTAVGSVSDLVVTTTESSHTTPTPIQPLEINCNNGVLKVSPNLANEKATSWDAIFTARVGILLSENNYYSIKITLKEGKTIPSGLYIGLGSVSEGSTAWTVKGGWVVSNGALSSTGMTSANLAGTNAGLNIFPGTITPSQVYDIFDIMLVKGSYTSSTIPEYVPYGQIYADGTVETINAHGKNLYDLETSENLANNGLVRPTKGDNELILTGAGSSANFSVMSFAKVADLEGKTVTLSYDNPTNNGSIVFAYCDADGANRKAKTTSTITISSLDAEGRTDIALRVNAPTSDPTEVFRYTNIQIEQGSTATEYQPYYNGGTATAEMLLKLFNKSGNTIYAQDVQNVTTGEITRNVGVKVLVGTETWTMGTNQDASNNRVFYTMIEDRKIQDTNMGLLCSHFNFKGSVGYSTLTTGEFCIHQSIKSVYFDGNGITTVDGWKQWLANQAAAGTPVIVIYPLETPTTESVAGQTLQVTDGDNVLEITQASLTGLELEATYKSLVQLTIEEVEDANLNNNVEVTIS